MARTFLSEQLNGITTFSEEIRTGCSIAAMESVSPTVFCYNFFVRPVGVTAIAAVFFLSSAYLATLGALRLISPDLIPLSLGAPLLHGLEISGPYMFLLAAAFVGMIAYGLLRLKNLARRAAIALLVAGTVLLIPKVSADAAELSLRLLTAAFAVIVRVAMAWYLWQSSTAEMFR